MRLFLGSCAGHLVNCLICWVPQSTYGHKPRCTNTHIFYSFTLSHSTLPHLLFQEESHAVTHLVSVDGGEGDVEEEAIQDRFGDPLQRNGQQQKRYANKDVGSQRCQAGLLYLDNTEEKTSNTHNDTYKNEWFLASSKSSLAIQQTTYFGGFPLGFTAYFTVVKYGCSQT